MFCLIVTICGLANTGLNSFHYGEFYFMLAGTFIELFLEYKLFIKGFPSLSKNYKNKQEIQNLENQIKIEKLQKELDELKKQNAN